MLRYGLAGLILLMALLTGCVSTPYRSYAVVDLTDEQLVEELEAVCRETEACRTGSAGIPLRSGPESK